MGNEPEEVMFETHEVVAREHPVNFTWSVDEPHTAMRSATPNEIRERRRQLVMNIIGYVLQLLRPFWR